LFLANPWTHVAAASPLMGASYLAPEHSGVRMEVQPENPLSYSKPPKDVLTEEQKSEFELMNEFGRLSLAEYPDDAAMRARIKSYELAFACKPPCRK
jgi:hypothetical protein